MYVPDPLPPSQGTVLFSGPRRSAEAHAEAAAGDASVTDAERDALTFTSYDLNVHLSPAKAGISASAAVSVRNDGSTPLRRVALQISSTLHWDSVSLLSPKGAEALRFEHHRVETDADHTGAAEEAVIMLPEALAPGEAARLDVLYSGTIPISGERLTRIGAPSRDAALADWDQIGPDGTFLRGFADVLWYPVAASPVLLGDGARLFEMAGRQKLRQSGAAIRLRLTVEYGGEAPREAFFNGDRRPLTPSRFDGERASPETPGSATAEFAEAPLGFRVPSLFVSNAASVASAEGLLTAVPRSVLATGEETALALRPYTEAAIAIRPLLTNWLGGMPLQTLTLFDHDGQPFEDDALLLTPLRAATAGAAEPALVHSMTHAWFRSRYAWLDEGVPQLMSLLWLERTHGRAAAVAELGEQAHALALAESNVESKLGSKLGEPGISGASPSAGQSLIEARDDVYYRNKAAAVLSMLRAIVGDENLQKGLQAYRGHGAGEEPKDLQHALELATGKELSWFFDDWVYHDRGLPDLSIASVSPRELPATGGRRAGWLVAVELVNAGGCVADVPITIRSGELTRTEHLRVPGKSRASTRIVFEGTPEELIVNDGTVPEAIASTHTRQLSLR